MKSHSAADARQNQLQKKSPTGSFPSAVPLAITRTFRPWTHTSDDSFIYQLSLVVATATVSLVPIWYSGVLHMITRVKTTFPQSWKNRNGVIKLTYHQHFFRRSLRRGFSYRVGAVRCGRIFALLKIEPHRAADFTILENLNELYRSIHEF